MSGRTRDRLAGVWTSIVKVPNVLDDDHFYNSGGDSMDAIRLIARACEEFDIAFDYKLFLDSPTFGTLYTAVRQAVGDDPEPTAHDDAVEKAVVATAELLRFRPFAGELPPKQTIAMASSHESSATAALVRALLETT